MTPNRLATFLAASMLALCASAAWAQSIQTPSAPPQSAPAPAPGAAAPSPAVSPEAAKDSRLQFLSDPITVEAKRQTAQARALNLIHDYSGKKHYWEAIAGWDDSICVAVAGLEPAKDQAVKARIEAVARDQGLIVKPDRCGPAHVAANIEILFTPDPDRLLKTIANTRPWMVGGVPTRTTPLIAVRAYENGLIMQRPIQAWYATACQPDVNWSGWEEDGAGGVFWAGGGSVAADDEPCQKIMFQNVLVVVDERRIPGLRLDVLTDYAAMLALTQPASLDGCNALPSVIDLFSRACADHPEPIGLTETDRAYLKALYTGGQNLPPGYQAPHDIAIRMAQILVPDRLAAR